MNSAQLPSAKRAGVTLFAALFHYDLAFMLSGALGSIAFFIAITHRPIAQKTVTLLIPPLGAKLARSGAAFIALRERTTAFAGAKA